MELSMYFVIFEEQLILVCFILEEQEMIGYADAGYLLDPHKVRSQTGYVFTCGGTTISWCLQKQTLIATSNHAEVIALHEASRECVWLRSVTQHIQATCGLPVNRDPTVLFEDNVVCVIQMKEEFIKSDRTKYIPPKFFSFSQELEMDKKININTFDPVIMQQIFLQRHFPLQL